MGKPSVCHIQAGPIRFVTVPHSPANGERGTFTHCGFDTSALKAELVKPRQSNLKREVKTCCFNVSSDV